MEWQTLSIHRYPVPSLLSDGLRAVIGATSTLGLIIAFDVVWPLVVILGGIGGIFVIFAFRVLERSLSSVELSEDRITVRALTEKSVAWQDIKDLKLAYYAAPKRPSEGWYQMTLAGGNDVLKVDSTIDGFDEIVAAAATMVAATDLTLDPTTGNNLRALGHGSYHDKV